MNKLDKTNTTSFDDLGLKTANKPLKQQRLGQEDFMKLMTTQLNHQDPFKPMENGEFLTQMAQFSAVTGLKEIKDEFKDLSAALQSSQALQASSLVGKRVLVPGNQTTLPDKGPLRGAVDLPASTSNLSIKITDAKGELVKTLDLGSKPAGTVHFSWDGKRKVPGHDGEPDSEQRAPAGTYRITAEALVDGKPQAVNTLVVDAVESVSLGKPGQPMTLNLSHAGSTRLTSVKQIM